jgi:citrate lyase subunit beta / citryl-CoA lyase
VADIKAERTEGQEETAWARGQVINAARAAGVQPLASVYPKFENEVDVYSYARSARAMGYEGVGCIHPRQIRPVHRAFAPSERELAEAKKIVDAYEASAGAAVGVDGRMVDVPVYNRARDVLERGQ